MTIYLDPVAKPRMTRSDKWKKRPIVVKYRQYCDSLREQFVGEVGGVIDVDFYLPMPNSWSNKKKMEMSGQPHTQRSDLDNIVKGFLDALCDEDSHVWSISARKFWAFEGRIEVNQQ